MKILIADDEAGIGRRLERLLRQFPEVDVVNFRTRTEEAILALLDLQPDLLILDHRFPNGTGYDIARKVSQYSPDTEVLMFSSYLTIQDRSRYEQAGIRKFFDKTTELNDLIAAVRQRAH